MMSRSHRMSTLMLVLALGMLIACSTKEEPTLNISEESYGKTPEGEAVALYTLTNGSMTVKITTYGGAVTELSVPDRAGVSGDVVLGFDSLGGYLGANPYFGCLVGRYGNRIAKGAFTLDGERYQLTINDGQNHLHGGIRGFDKVVWKATPLKGRDSVALTLTYVSADGEQGYPGELRVTVSYVVTTKNELRILYAATTDKSTIVNLTHHSYFNLAGPAAGDVLGHEMMIHADAYTPVNEVLIPTGKVESVKGTPFDFRQAEEIGARIANVKGGYDHNFVLTRKGKGLELAAEVTESASGRVMEVWTTEPGLQFYSGNFLDGSIAGKNGISYKKYYGFCLEAQHYPDSPNQPSFAPTVLRPGEDYTQETVYRFGLMD